jgi:hypothetical protein
MPGCYLVSENGSETGTEPGGGTAQEPGDEGGNGNSVVPGNSPFGIAPFSLGLGQFLKDLCKWLPNGLCDLVKKIIVILIIVLVILAAMKVYKTVKK